MRTMPRTIPLALLALTLLIHSPRATAQAPGQQPDADGFVPMFNGKDLSGWVNVNCAPNTFTVRDGMIVSTGVPTGVLRTQRMYTNFIVELEWRHLKPRGNAGFFAWSSALPVCGQPFTKAIEVQIIDSENPEGIATRHGDVFAIQGATMVPDKPHPRGWMRSLPSEKRVKPQGEWNHYRIEARDGVITLAVNGKVVSGGSRCVPRKGYIVLESEGSECHFRNVRVKELPDPATPVPAEETAEADQGYQSLYTGINLAGWRFAKGSDGHWQAKDWTLVYDGKSEANDKNLYTQQEYRDFSLILDWRHTTREGSKKIPVILPGGATLDVESDRRPDQWSRAIVTVQAGTLTVVLNDKTVIDKQRFQEATQPGPIALQHREHPMQFANLYIKDLTRVASANGTNGTAGVVASATISPDQPKRSLTLIEQHPRPILYPSSPGAQDNKYGFEGGRVVKLRDTYHLFVSEMNADPKWTKTRLAHWTSTDRFNWKRVSTLHESTGDFTGSDERAALFLPIPAFDDSIDRWTLFYSAFRSAPNSDGKWLINHDGKIWRALSKQSGIDGIAGPYEDASIVLQPGPQSDPWEGLQGTTSFFPFRVGNQWLAFYGSAHTQHWPCTFWGVGLLAAPSLAGPWTRLSNLNPVLIDKLWVENPHVTKLPDNTYVAIFDATKQGRALGYSFSTNGTDWTPAQYLPLSAGENHWLAQPRTPLGLIPCPDGSYECFFTGNDQSGYACLSWLRVRID